MMKLRTDNLAVAALALMWGSTGCVHMPTQLPTQLTLWPSKQPAERPERTAEPRTAAPTKELPNNDAAAACVVTAETLEKGGRDQDAIALCERARQLDPQREAEMTRRLAVLYGRVGQFDRAKSEFNRALARSPGDADLLNDLGYFYYSRGLWTEAETTLRNAVAAAPKHERAWVNLGMTLAQQGRYPESIEAFQKVISPGKAYCNLGFILAVQGKRDQALSAYQKAIRFESDLQMAQTALEKLNASPTPQADAPANARREQRRPRPMAPESVAPVAVEVVDGDPLDDDLDAPIHISTEAARPAASTNRKQSSSR
jgi:tetratricopeptide (TPR) repeat protein